MPDIVRSFSCMSVIFSILISLLFNCCKSDGCGNLFDFVAPRYCTRTCEASLPIRLTTTASEFNLSDVILSFGMDVEVIGEFFREVSERVREGDRKKGRGREGVCTM